MIKSIRVGVYGGMVQWVEDIPEGIEIQVFFLAGSRSATRKPWKKNEDCAMWAMTRAMDRLYLSACGRRTINNRAKTLQESAFLNELIL